MIYTIGLIAVFSILITLLITQYTLMILGVVRDDLNTIERGIGWVPYLPFILMLIFGVYFIITDFMITPTARKIVRWFELRWGWLFVKNKNRDVWGRYLRSKYND